ncbi:MAG: flagellar brake domain-containing protein [Firmicutes bacterium]|nr:flagellar brake domain-containing protein [Bacillota bacterium]
MFGLFGPKSKFKLQDNMEVELEFTSGETFKSYFVKVVEVTSKKASFMIPRENNKPVPLSKEDIVRLIVLIGDTIYEVNLKVTNVMEKEFEAMISKNMKHYETLLKKFDKNQAVNLEVTIPLEYRAITTSHIQRANTKTITKEFVEMVTNLPIPERTDLKLFFKTPESPIVETEGTSAKSEPLAEDSKKSSTKITFPEKVMESNVFGNITRYVVHHQRREERRKELLEEIQGKKDDGKTPAKPADKKK